MYIILLNVSATCSSWTSQQMLLHTSSSVCLAHLPLTLTSALILQGCSTVFFRTAASAFPPPTEWTVHSAHTPDISYSLSLLLHYELAFRTEIMTRLSELLQQMILQNIGGMGETNQRSKLFLMTFTFIISTVVITCMVFFCLSLCILSLETMACSCSSCLRD